MHRRSRDAEGSFPVFFEQTKDRVFRTLALATGDRSLAEELTAEAFTRAYEHWDDVAVHPSPAAWVTRTALNGLRSRIRSDHTSSADLPEIAADDPPPIDPTLVELLQVLPQRQREVVALRLLMDLSEQQTAAVLGISENTVGVHLHRAIEHLRSALGEEVDDEVSRRAYP